MQVQQRTLRLEARDLSPELPLALAELHRELPVGARLALQMGEGGWSRERLCDVVTGAGFDPGRARKAGTGLRLTALRIRSLPDTVNTGMRVLVCGLNPSLVAADAGYGYAGRSNRFWPAALAAGLVTVARDPLHALRADHVGMTDLVKRATPSAAVLTPEEYRLGLGRVRRLVEWLPPGRVLFVGLSGWRAVVNRWALPGWQPFDSEHGLPVPAYLMPSTSGLNARTALAELVGHIEAALAAPPVA